MPAVKHKNKRLKNSISIWWPYVVIVTAMMLAVLAGWSLLRTQASTQVGQHEAEHGDTAGYAVKCDITGTSGGKVVRFGRSSCVDATVPGGQLIGWKDVVNGPGGAWHRLLRLPDGSWLRVLTVFPAAGRAELEVYRSTDHARTWGKISGINDGNRLVDNGFLYQAPNGDVLLSGRNNVLGSSYKISQWRSTNGGHSWSREADVDSTGGGPRGLWEPFYYTAGDGRVAVMWADEAHTGNSQVLMQKLSADNGRTWSGERVVVSDGANGRPGMAGVTRMTNGQYFFTYEVCGTQGCAVFYKKSADGVNWPGGIGSRIPGQVCGPFVTSLSDGRLVVTACRVSDGDHATPVSYSDDFGTSWKTNSSAFTDAGEFGHWPALYQIGPNEIAAVSAHRIRFGTFNQR